jgi:choline monooxygenase
MALTRTLPASWYGDAAIHERERQGIFAREWLCVGVAAALCRAGDYVATTICGWPIVVVALDDRGTLAAHHNVCRHRAGPLVWDGAGHCGGSFVCRYHGWAYGLDGTLKAARDFGADLADLESTDLGLLPLTVDTWRGLVFVNLQPGPPPLADDLGDFATACAPFPIESFTLGREVHEVMDANWKAYADNYLEGYHLPLVHPGLTRQVDAKQYRVEVHDRWCLHTAPARDGSATAGAWLWRFPNLALNVYPDGMNVERFWPDGTGRTIVDYSYCFAPGTDPGEQDASVKLSLELLDEDRSIVEAVQRNLRSGVYDTGALSPRHEGAVAAFQALVRRAVDAAHA